MSLNKKLFVVIGVLAFIGFLDATFLTIKHYTGGPIPCSIFDGCDIVTTSKYSTLAGFPISLAGAVYYTLILLLSAAYITGPKVWIAKFVKTFTILGFLVSLVLVYLQVFVLKALCAYCLFSAATSTIVFLLGRFLQKEAVTQNA